MKSTHRPFSPALMGLCGVVAGMCFVVLAFAFVRDMSPRQVFHRQGQPWMPPAQQGMERPEHVPNLNEATTVNDVAVVPTTTRDYAEQAYRNEPFRVIKVIQSPDELYSYIVATPRAEYGPTGESATSVGKLANDTACGSRYTQPVCYLFREGAYNVASNPAPTLMAAWSGGAFYEDTAVKFVKKGANYLMQFTSADGDAGCSSTFSHQIDLATSEYSLLKRTDRCAN